MRTSWGVFLGLAVTLAVLAVLFRAAAGLLWGGAILVLLIGAVTYLRHRSRRRVETRDPRGHGQ